MHFHRYRRRIHRLLPVLDRILRTGRYPNNFPRTNRQNPGIQTPGMARRHNNCNEKGLGETRNGSSRNDEKLKNAGYRLNLKKCEFFRKEIKWVENKIDQHGILLLQDKLEAITKIDTPKNEKELKSFLGALQYLSNYRRKLISKHRYSEKITEEEQRMELDRRTRECIQQTKRIHHKYPMFSTLQGK